MRWYNSNNPDGFTVDGVTSLKEDQMNRNPDEWRCIVGPNGWIVHRSLWDEYYRSQSEIKVHYRDDIQHEDPPDYFPGDLGYYYVESTVRSLKPGKYNFQLEWYFPYDFYDPEGLRMDIIEQIVNIRDHPIRIRVDAREVTNAAGEATLVDP